MTPEPAPRPGPVPTGIDALLADSGRLAALRDARVGLLTHDPARAADGTPTRRALAAALGSGPDGGLVRLFTPEHGLAADRPAGGAVPDGTDAETGLAVVSLYGTRATPDAAMLADLDAIVVDLRDVGVRCFTYAATAARLIEAAAGTPLALIICDRPNPLGPRTAGPDLDPALRSLVAWLDVPFVHGRTMAGLLRPVAERAGLHFEPVAAPDGPTAPGMPWVPPSPALDHPDAVRFYPGLVLLEATNLCEGRGTHAPFRSVAAPWLDTAALATEIAGWRLPVETESGTLTPDAGDHAGTRLPALVFRLADPQRFDGFEFGVRLLCAIAAHHRQFDWSRAPQADATAPWTIDALLGSSSLREAMARGADADTILAGWVR